MRRAISPVIATVILIAVTIAIGIAVAGWLMGVWGTFGGGEALKIYPNYTLDDDEGHFDFFVGNVGSAPTRIIKITVGDYECKTFDTPGGFPIINPGQKRNIYCRVVDKNGNPVSLGAGSMYYVKIVTEAGNVYTIYTRTSYD